MTSGRPELWWPTKGRVISAASLPVLFTGPLTYEPKPKKSAEAAAFEFTYTCIPRGLAFDAGIGRPRQGIETEAWVPRQIPDVHFQMPRIGRLS